MREHNNNLSRYLARVHGGDEVMISDRGRAVAKIALIGTERTIDRLIAQGVVTPASRAKQCAHQTCTSHPTRKPSRSRPASLITYFDTSALVPLLAEEPGSERANLLWNEADRILAIRLAYAEAHAALSMAARHGLLDQADLRTAVLGFDQLYRQMAIIEISDNLLRRAGVLAENHSLRGYDAVHLAAAEALSEEGVVRVTGDGPLSQAASALGLAVART